MKVIETDRELNERLCGTLDTPMREEVDCKLNDRLWYVLYGKLKNELYVELSNELNEELNMDLSN